MGKIHLIEGPVGAGKSTYAGKLALELSCAHLNLDEWMVTLFRPDRPATDFMAWYGERKDRCIDQIWLVAIDLLNHDQNVILELGLVQKSQREAFYNRVAGTDFELQIHLLETEESLRWERVQKRNEQAPDDPNSTLKMEVSREVFEMANAAWQAPDEAECERHGIRVIHQ